MGKDDGQPASGEVGVEAGFELGESREVHQHDRGGPRLGALPIPMSFDGWLLEQAKERGAIVQRAQVRSIQPGSRPLIVMAQETIEADLVILATGVNSRTNRHPARCLAARLCPRLRAGLPRHRR